MGGGQEAGRRLPRAINHLNAVWVYVTFGRQQCAYVNTPQGRLFQFRTRLKMLAKAFNQSVGLSLHGQDGRQLKIEWDTTADGRKGRDLDIQGAVEQDEIVGITCIEASLGRLEDPHDLEQREDPGGIAWVIWPGGVLRCVEVDFSDVGTSRLHRAVKGCRVFAGRASQDAPGFREARRDNIAGSQRPSAFSKWSAAGVLGCHKGSEAPKQRRIGAPSTVHRVSSRAIECHRVPHAANAVRAFSSPSDVTRPRAGDGSRWVTMDRQRGADLVYATQRFESICKYSYF
ncbi:hypothetical protein DFH09DRAFT_1103330 [Mycena vulgaris]|nr:hypothetical protein DFH09DRAFT_1103330 [Mycena vulgaris]